MMNNISPIAWVFIGFLVVFTISINIWLFTAKNKQPKNNNLIFNRMIQTIQDPFAEEKINLQKLSEAAAKLRETSTEKEN